MVNVERDEQVVIAATQETASAFLRYASLGVSAIP
jgi:hypothetical protein